MVLVLDAIKLSGKCEKKSLKSYNIVTKSMYVPMLTTSSLHRNNNKSLTWNDLLLEL